MIVFDLDGTIADCEHRRHFIDPKKQAGYMIAGYDEKGELLKPGSYQIDNKKWKPHWKKFFEACDQDRLIEPVAEIWNSYEVDICLDRANLQIWSGRCESVREKTIEWLDKNLFGLSKEWFSSILKMRPIGDSTPDDVLKEKWLDELIHKRIGDGLENSLKTGESFCVSDAAKPIKIVFDDRPKVVRMWQRRGIFVFNCCQHGDEF